MARTLAVYTDPYTGVAASVITSNVVDLRDAFDLSVSWFTTSGATSTITLQISNADLIESIAEASWSNFTRFGQNAPLPSSQASTIFPALGVRYLRFLRRSGSTPADVQINLNKFVK